MLSPNLLALLLPNAALVNPTNVANALDGFVTNTNGSLPASFQPLYSLSPTQLQAALTQLDGEVHVDSRQSAETMMNSFISVMLNPFADSRAGVFGPALGFAPDREDVLPPEVASAYAGIVRKAPPKMTTPGRYNVWGAGFGGSNRIDGDPVRLGSSDVRTSAGGFAAGIDYRVTANTVIGFAAGGGATKWDLSNGLGGGKSDVFQVGAYSSTEIGSAYVSTAFAYGYHNMSTSRVTALAGPGVLNADFDAWNIGGRIEAGYRISAPINFTPYVAFQAQSFHAPSYLETSTAAGPGFALTIAAQEAFAARAEVGSWFSKSFMIDPAGTTLGWFGRVAYAHDHHDNPAVSAVFQSVPGSFFVVNGAEPARSLALVTAGVEARFANNVAISARFDGEFSNRSESYSGTAKLRYSW